MTDIQAQYPSLVSCGYMAFVKDAAVLGAEEDQLAAAGAVAAAGAAEADGDSAQGFHIPRRVRTFQSSDGPRDSQKGSAKAGCSQLKKGG